MTVSRTALSLTTIQSLSSVMEESGEKAIYGRVSKERKAASSHGVFPGQCFLDSPLSEGVRCQQPSVPGEAADYPLTCQGLHCLELEDQGQASHFDVSIQSWLWKANMGIAA